MKNSINEEKVATQCGYFPLFHYNPVSREFILDSSADFSKYKEFILGEDRYKSLSKLNKDHKRLLDLNQDEAYNRYKYYEGLVGIVSNTDKNRDAS